MKTKSKKHKKVFRIIKKCLEAAQIENKINHLDNDKIIQLIYSLETYAHGTNKDLVGNKWYIISKNIRKQCKHV